MKHIVKNNEPKSFKAWKDLENDDWQPTYDVLKNPEKKEVKESLINEQGAICCYCEIKLDFDDSHIEHLNPQSNSEDLRLDYNNMLCSCQKELSKGEPRHCGNSKGGWYDKELFISPLDENCEDKFVYKEDGTIKGIDKASQKTIEKLNLHIDKLNELRQKAIEPFILVDSDSDDEISIDDTKKFAEDYLKNTNGMYNEFYTTIKYLFVS